MSEKLIVIEPIFNLNTGDELVYDKDTKMYSYKASEKSDKSSYQVTFSVSEDYAKELLNDGYLDEPVADTNKEFKNVFSEIQSLISQYESELHTIDSDYQDKPACMKVEKITVLNNIIKVLQHLMTLKK